MGTAARNSQVVLKIAHLPDLPDLVLLDIVRLDMDGFEVSSKIKASGGIPAVPVILQGGEAGKDVRKQTKRNDNDC
jgi:CheY-like chemotaxis protein